MKSLVVLLIVQKMVFVANTGYFLDNSIQYWSDISADIKEPI